MVYSWIVIPREKKHKIYNGRKKGKEEMSFCGKIRIKLGVD